MQRLITIGSTTDIEMEFFRLGEEDDWLRTLVKTKVLTRDQAEVLWVIAQYRIRHSKHLFNLSRYVGAGCLVDGIRTVRVFRRLLNDKNFLGKIREDLMPECVWGLWF
jgi:hypothetical protein